MLPAKGSVMFSRIVCQSIGSRAEVGVIVLAMLLGGCTSPNGETRPVSIGTAKGISTTGSTRVITERVRDNRIVCTEPSPDYAVAFNTTRKVTITVPVKDKTATGEAENTVDETIKDAGAGRTAAVMALRDGLYAACQSYANGVIGHDAYAIILSQYGALLVALVSPATDRAAGGAGVAAATPRNPALSALTVACVSNYDQTRSKGPTNSLLTPGFCTGVFQAALKST